MIGELADFGDLLRHRVPTWAIDDLFAIRVLGRPGPDGLAAAAKAYVLVSLVRPELSAKSWAALTRHYGRRSPWRAGLMAIEDRRGYAHAVFRYEVDTAPPLGARTGWVVDPDCTGDCRLLRVQEPLLASVPGEGLERALARSAESLADALRCPWISLELPAGELRDGSAANLLKFGFQELSVTVLTRALATPPERLGAAVRPIATC